MMFVFSHSILVVKKGYPLEGKSKMKESCHPVIIQILYYYLQSYIHEIYFSFFSEYCMISIPTVLWHKPV